MSESNEPDIMYHGAEWFEKNKGKLLYGALAVIIAAGGIQFYWKNTAQTKAASESALFAIQYRDATNLEDIAGAYGTVSTDQAGKPVAERALILSAKTWLEAADYDKAQAAFKSYLDQHADGFWADEAKLGQAICQEANGDEANAKSTYQSLTNSTVTVEQLATAFESGDVITFAGGGVLTLTSAASAAATSLAGNLTVAAINVGETGRTPVKVDVVTSTKFTATSAIQSRAAALLEAAQIKLDPLVQKPKPAPVPPAAVAKPATPVTPAAPVAPPTPVAPPAPVAPATPVAPPAPVAPPDSR